MAQEFPPDEPQEEAVAGEQTKGYEGANVAKKNWKADLPFGKAKPMPPSDYKKKIK